MEQRKRDWIKEGLELVSPKDCHYWSITSGPAYIGGLRVSMRIDRSHDEQDRIFCSWRADGSPGPVIINGEHQNHSYTESPAVPMLVISDRYKTEVFSELHAWAVRSPFKSPPEKPSADRSQADAGTPAPPSSAPKGSHGPQAGEGDGQRRLTRMVEFAWSADYGNVWRARPRDDRTHEFQLGTDDPTDPDMWEEELYGKDTHFERAMFAAEDRLLAQHPADATVLNGSVHNGPTAPLSRLDSQATPCDWEELGKAIEGCTKAASDALRSAGWTLNGEITDDPDGRALLHGAPVCPSAAEIVAGTYTQEMHTKIVNQQMPAQTLDPWQEDALAMLRRVGFSDADVYVGRLSVSAEAGKLRVCGAEYDADCSPPWSAYVGKTVVRLDSVNECEEWIRARLREAHARLGEIVGGAE